MDRKKLFFNHGWNNDLMGLRVRKISEAIYNDVVNTNGLSGIVDISERVGLPAEVVKVSVLHLMRNGLITQEGDQYRSV